LNLSLIEHFEISIYIQVIVSLFFSFLCDIE
jgi:hypothetical protein